MGFHLHHGGKGGGSSKRKNVAEHRFEKELGKNLGNLYDVKPGKTAHKGNYNASRDEGSQKKK